MSWTTAPAAAPDRPRSPTSTSRTARASGPQPSPGLPRRAAGRPLWRLQDAGEETQRRLGRARLLLGAPARRRFFEIHVGTASPIAAEALLRIGEIYTIERESRGQPPQQRVAIRQARSAPLVAAMQAWLRTQLDRVSPLAEAIRHGLRHWAGLERFLTDGRFELDTNIVERKIRPVAVTRKGELFAGGEGGDKRRRTVNNQRPWVANDGYQWRWANARYARRATWPGCFRGRHRRRPALLADFHVPPKKADRRPMRSATGPHLVRRISVPGIEATMRTGRAES